MTKTRMTFLVLLIACALWALFIHTPPAGRAAILLYIVLLPELVLAGAWLAKRARGRHAR